MGTAHDNRRDHVLRQPLEIMVKDALSRKMNAKQIVELLLGELDEANIISYTPKSKVNLLTPAGRVMCLLLEKPGVTIREMSTILGVTETSILKAISLLIKEKLVTRTKVKGRYEHRINLKNARYHPDLRRLMRLVHEAVIEEEVISQEENSGQDPNILNG